MRGRRDNRKQPKGDWNNNKPYAARSENVANSNVELVGSGLSLILGRCPIQESSAREL